MEARRGIQMNSVSLLILLQYNRVRRKLLCSIQCFITPVGNLEIVTDGEVVTQLEYLYQYTHLRFPTNHELYILKK